LVSAILTQISIIVLDRTCFCVEQALQQQWGSPQSWKVRPTGLKPHSLVAPGWCGGINSSPALAGKALPNGDNTLATKIPGPTIANLHGCCL
jgi:hypothetical protein